MLPALRRSLFKTMAYAFFLLTAVFGDDLWALRMPIVNLPLRLITSLPFVVGTGATMVGHLATISKGGVGKAGSSVAVSYLCLLSNPQINLNRCQPVAEHEHHLPACTPRARLRPADHHRLQVNEPSLRAQRLPLRARLRVRMGQVHSEADRESSTSPWSPAIELKCLVFKVAHMTKGQVYLNDSCLVGPGLLLVNQYLSFLVPEYAVLWLCLVSGVNSSLNSIQRLLTSFIAALQPVRPAGLQLQGVHADLHAPTDPPVSVGQGTAVSANREYGADRRAPSVARTPQMRLSGCSPCK
jgi:hypothetical protein